MAVPALTNDSNWSVASFDGKVVGGFHPVPWHFSPNGVVEAEGHWIANWREIGQDRINCRMTSGGNDSWDLVFVTNKWFVAYKGDNLYRLGYRR